MLLQKGKDLFRTRVFILDCIAFRILYTVQCLQRSDFAYGVDNPTYYNHMQW